MLEEDPAQRRKKSPGNSEPKNTTMAVGWLCTMWCCWRSAVGAAGGAGGAGHAGGGGAAVIYLGKSGAPNGAPKLKNDPVGRTDLAVAG